MWLRRSKKAVSSTAGPAAPDGSPSAVVGSDLTVTGRLQAPGEIRIHGTVTGDVYAPRVVLCEDGFLDGKLVAEDAVIEGWLRGQVFAFRVVVESTSVIEGTVFHHELAVAPGSHLDGRTPWRPLNWFEDLSNDFEGEPDEHVRA